MPFFDLLYIILGSPKWCLPARNLSQLGETDLSLWETQEPLLGQKHSFGSKNPMKAGDKKAQKTGLWRAKTPKSDLWHYGLRHLHHQPRSHSQETGFSKRGLPHFLGIFAAAKIDSSKKAEESV